MTDEPVVDREDVPVESDDEAEPAQTEPAQSEAAQPELAAAAATNESPAPTATAVLTHVVRSIVDDADAVRVDAVEGRNRLKLEVKVGPGDLGRVIGRRGRTAQSIRTVVRAAATRDGVEVDVDFVD
ncbi:MAG: uncharacterized protein QOJ08_119 [Ilumatobacteraceae bacterium]